MGAYELWQGAMYCVGVFVTCNVGGMGLRWAASALRKRCAADEAKPDEWKGQSFADMMREVDAHKADYPPDAAEADASENPYPPDPPGEPGEPGAPVTPEELAEAYRRTAAHAQRSMTDGFKPAPDAPSETDAA